MPAMEPGRLHRKRWPPSIGTRGRVQLDCLAAIVGIRIEIEHSPEIHRVAYGEWREGLLRPNVSQRVPILRQRGQTRPPGGRSRKGPIGWNDASRVAPSPSSHLASRFRSLRRSFQDPNDPRLHDLRQNAPRGFPETYPITWSGSATPTVRRKSSTARLHAGIIP